MAQQQNNYSSNGNQSNFLMRSSHSQPARSIEVSQFLNSHVTSSQTQFSPNVSSSTNTTIASMNSEQFQLVKQGTESTNYFNQTQQFQPQQFCQFPTNSRTDAASFIRFTPTTQSAPQQPTKNCYQQNTSINNIQPFVYQANQNSNSLHVDSKLQQNKLLQNINSQVTTTSGKSTPMYNEHHQQLNQQRNNSFTPTGQLQHNNLDQQKVQNQQMLQQASKQNAMNFSFQREQQLRSPEQNLQYHSKQPQIISQSTQLTNQQTNQESLQQNSMMRSSCQQNMTHSRQSQQLTSQNILSTPKQSATQQQQQFFQHPTNKQQYTQLENDKVQNVSQQKNQPLQRQPYQNNTEMSSDSKATPFQSSLYFKNQPSTQQQQQQQLNQQSQYQSYLPQQRQAHHQSQQQSQQTQAQQQQQQQFQQTQAQQYLQLQHQSQQQTQQQSQQQTQQQSQQQTQPQFQQQTQQQFQQQTQQQFQQQTQAQQHFLQQPQPKHFSQQHTQQQQLQLKQQHSQQQWQQTSQLFQQSENHHSSRQQKQLPTNNQQQSYQQAQKQLNHVQLSQNEQHLKPNEHQAEEIQQHLSTNITPVTASTTSPTTTIAANTQATTAPSCELIQQQQNIEENLTKMQTDRTISPAAQTNVQHFASNTQHESSDNVDVEKDIVDVENIFNQNFNIHSDQSATSIQADEACTTKSNAAQHKHKHQHHQQQENTEDDDGDDDDDDDDDDEDDDDDDEDDDDDDEYSTEDSSEGSSDDQGYDQEGQGYFDDTSASKQLADVNHRIHKKAASLHDRKTGRQRKPMESRNYKGALQSYVSNFNRAQLENSCNRCVDLLREKDVIPETGSEVNLPPMSDNFVCDPEVMCCTLNVLPNTPALLQKARLPLAVHVQPLKDIPNVPVVKVDTIVRCRLCRMYINPYVVIIDRHRWKCCMCSRFNDLPEDFSYDVKRKAYTNGRHRNEMNSSSYEVIASPEYIVGNLAVPVYFFLLDVSFNAIETGYLISLCQSVIEKLEYLKTHDNVMVGVMTFHTSVHLYNIHHRNTKPIVYKLPDLENLFVPAPDGLLVNLKTSQSLFVDLLTNLPSMHKDNKEIGSCLGPALKLAYEILAPTGGRVSIFQTKIPDVGEGSLKSREDPNKRAGEVVQNLTAATDFYKKVALDGSSSHVAFDLFMLNTQYADLATLSVLSRYSGGCLFYFPNYHLTSNPVESSRFDETLDRYFSTNVGFEAVLRVRCTQGLSLQLFHGNGFVRSVDLLSLSSVTPDLSYAVQIQMEDSIEDTRVCIQAALLYTTNRFERRIRVHTICLPVSTYLSDVFAHANQMAITALVAKMAVDRSLNSSVADAREALTNVALDALNAYGENLSSGQRGGQLPCPFFLRALPLYILGLLKSIPFRLGVSTKLDDRVFMLDQFKTLPWTHIIKYIHPNFYPLHKLNDRNALYVDDRVICQPPLLPLSAGCMDRQGIYLLDDGYNMYLWLSSSVSRAFLRDVLGVQKFGDVLSGLFEFPHLDNVWSENVRNFIEYLQSTRSTYSPVILIRDDQTDRVMFYERLLEDRTSDVLNMSYIEFIRHLHSLVTY